jgi:putative oxidoreductase
MSYGILFLRVIVGGVFFAHGTQKLFGWWGGSGPRGTAGFFGSLGFRNPLVMALVAGTSETAGALFALGLLTPFAALAVASVMVVAVGSVHVNNGFWVSNGGFEYSLDRVIGWSGTLSGLWWGVGVLGVSLLGGLIVLSTREQQPEPERVGA